MQRFAVGAKTAFAWCVCSFVGFFFDDGCGDDGLRATIREKIAGLEAQVGAVVACSIHLKRRVEAEHSFNAKLRILIEPPLALTNAMVVSISASDEHSFSAQSDESAVAVEAAFADAFRTLVRAAPGRVA